MAGTEVEQAPWKRRLSLFLCPFLTSISAFLSWRLLHKTAFWILSIWWLKTHYIMYDNVLCCIVFNSLIYCSRCTLITFRGTVALNSCSTSSYSGVLGGTVKLWHEVPLGIGSQCFGTFITSWSVMLQSFIILQMYSISDSKLYIFNSYHCSSLHLTKLIHRSLNS